MQRLLNHVLEPQSATVLKYQLKSHNVKISTKSTTEPPRPMGGTKLDILWLRGFPVLEGVCQVLHVLKCWAFLFDLVLLNLLWLLYLDPIAH